MKKILYWLFTMMYFGIMPFLVCGSTMVWISDYTIMNAYADDTEEDIGEEAYDIDWISEKPHNTNKGMKNLNENIKDGGRSLNVLGLTLGGLAAVLSMIGSGLVLLFGNHMQKGEAKISILNKILGVILIFGSVPIVALIISIARNLFVTP